MSKIRGMVADAQRRWSETREPTLAITCTGVEFVVPTIPYPSLDSATWAYQCLPYRNVSLTAHGHIYQFNADRVLCFHPRSWLLLNVTVLDSFLPDRETRWDIEIAPKDGDMPAWRYGPWLAVCTHHFEPLPFQRVKTFPKGWAASGWVVGKLPPTLRSVLSKLGAHERELRRMEAESWD